jgi:hypothetical protein
VRVIAAIVLTVGTVNLIIKNHERFIFEVFKQFHVLSLAPLSGWRIDLHVSPLIEISLTQSLYHSSNAKLEKGWATEGYIAT